MCAYIVCVNAVNFHFSFIKRCVHYAFSYRDLLFICLKFLFHTS